MMTTSPNRSGGSWWLVLLLLVAACEGSLEGGKPGPRLTVPPGATPGGSDPGSDPGSEPGTDPGSPDPTDPATDPEPIGGGQDPEPVPDPGAPDVDACAGVPLAAARPRLTRLSHVQYDYVLTDLFGLASDLAASFAPDPVLGGFDNNAEALRVDARLLVDYQEAAESVALEVVGTGTAYARVVPCTPSGDGTACARQMITAFGRRAFRRPLASAEIDRYAALFAAAPDLYSEGSSFDRGVRAVIESMLQSPNFLYQQELEAGVELVDGQSLVRLSGYTVASRLAATLWASIPDDALLDAAAAGQLDTPEGIRAQAERMVASEKLLRVVDDFHEQWLSAHEFGAEAKVPALPETAGDSMRRELLEFVRYVLENDGTYEDLLTSPFSFTDATLAALYGTSGGSGTSLALTSLDPTQRAGLLTQIGFLSAHASAAASSPIHRGVFVLRRFLCSDIQPPSFAIDPTLPPFSDEIVTTRDQVEHHTSNSTCQTCHKTINALGFAFEHYDARGVFRTHENGAPIDATGSLELGGEALAFDGGVDLSTQIAQSAMGGRCYIDKWLGYSFGRVPNAADSCTALSIDAQLGGGTHRIRQVLIGLTGSTAFRYRVPEE